MNRGEEIDHSTSAARRALAELCSNGVNESASRYAEFQQIEAAGRIKDLEQALATLNEIEQQRLERWRQAVHDVRGKFGVIKNITDQLSNKGDDQNLKDEFLGLLAKSVVSLHDLLDNLLVLSRLEAGQERRQIQTMDAALLLKELCDSCRPFAAEHGLLLHAEGPESLAVQGDPVNIQRIAQNLLLNAIRYTLEGNVTVGWEALDTAGPRRWAFFVRDTGPGFQSSSAAPLAQTIEALTLEEKTAQQTPAPKAPPSKSKSTASMAPRHSPQQSGEGIGLAIVKRLCELLDATLELDTVPDQGSRFRVVLPSVYDVSYSRQE
jgi:signal transduction histidine kinase